MRTQVPCLRVLQILQRLLLGEPLRNQPSSCEWRDLAASDEVSGKRIPRVRFLEDFLQSLSGSFSLPCIKQSCGGAVETVQAYRA